MLGPYVWPFRYFMRSAQCFGYHTDSVSSLESAYVITNNTDKYWSRIAYMEFVLDGHSIIRKKSKETHDTPHSYANYTSARDTINSGSLTVQHHTG